MNTEIKDQQIDECIGANVVDPKFDKVITDNDMSVSNLRDGIVSSQYFKTSDYHDMLSVINTTKTLQGSLQCYLKFA